MYSKNSLHFQNDWQDLQPAWTLLKGWLESHEHSRVISPAAIAEFYSSDSSVQTGQLLLLPELLGAFVENGSLVRKYAVEAPSGELLFPYYDSRSEVPEIVTGVFDSEAVYTKDAKVIPVFLRVNAK